MRMLNHAVLQIYVAFTVGHGGVTREVLSPLPHSRASLLQVVQADRCWHHSLPLRNESRGGPAHPKFVSLHPAMGEWVHWLSESVGRVCPQAPRGYSPEQVCFHVQSQIIVCEDRQWGEASRYLQVLETLLVLW